MKMFMMDTFMSIKNLNNNTFKVSNPNLKTINYELKIFIYFVLDI